MKNNVLITGGNGQVGSELKVLLDGAKHNLFFTDVADLDITNLTAVQSWFALHQPNWVINCAAYTAVDKAEEQKDLCYLINETGAQNLAVAAKAQGARMIHISSDYVYNNRVNRPMIETDPCLPQSVYAASKLAGDQVVLATDANNLVLRTSWVYSSFGHNFVKTMIRLGKIKEQLTVVADQIGTPTYARDLAGLIRQIAIEAPHTPGGIYHYSNEGTSSWYDFAKAIMELEGLNCQVLPIPTSDYPTPAARPPFSLLNKAKIKQQLSLSIPHWRDSLKECLEVLKNSE